VVKECNLVLVVAKFREGVERMEFIILIEEEADSTLHRDGLNGL